MLKPLLLMLGLFAVAAITAPAYAQQNIAVVDIQRIMRDSAASKSANDQLQKYLATYQQEISKQENELRSAEQELTRQRTIVSPEAFAERRRALEQRFANLQRDVENRKRELDKSRVAATRTVETAMSDIVKSLVTERKYTLILVKNQTIYSAPEMEVTEEVMKRLNAKLPSIKVPPPAPVAATPAKPPGK